MKMDSHSILAIVIVAVAVQVQQTRALRFRRTDGVIFATRLSDWTCHSNRFDSRLSVSHGAGLFCFPMPNAVSGDHSALNPASRILMLDLR